MISSLFFNQFASNPQNLAVLAGSIAFVLAAFGWIYNGAMSKRRERVYTAIYVVGGVLITLAGVAVLSWKAAVICLAAFVASGLPMVIGDMIRSTRTEAVEASARRKRLPYADRGLVEDALVKATQVQRALAKIAAEKLPDEDVMRLVACATIHTNEAILKLTEVGK